MPPQALADLVAFLPATVKERELAMARKVVHRVLAMLDSHYKGLDRKALRGGWAPGYSDDEYDKLEEDCAVFARGMADAAMNDPDLFPKDTPNIEDNSRPSS
jgi:hypothetical protein